MLIYNDQKDFTTKRIEELYGVFVPEDNFWRKLNKTVDFAFLEILKDKYPTTKDKSQREIVRMFKCLLLKAYYRLSDSCLLKRIETDIVFRFFLEYEPTEMCSIEESLLADFSREIISVEDLKTMRENSDYIDGLNDNTHLEEKFFTLQELAVSFLNGVKNKIDVEDN